jgi:hypothetical protein
VIRLLILAALCWTPTFFWVLCVAWSGKQHDRAEGRQ